MAWNLTVNFNTGWMSKWHARIPKCCSLAVAKSPVFDLHYWCCIVLMMITICCPTLCGAPRNWKHRSIWIFISINFNHWIYEYLAEKNGSIVDVNYLVSDLPLVVNPKSLRRVRALSKFICQKNLELTISVIKSMFRGLSEIWRFTYKDQGLTNKC